MRADLHFHSKYSDGSLWPNELAEMAKNKGLEIVALTDHNTFDGVNDFFRVAIKPNYEEYIEVVNFKVYNRWGRLIYNNENPKGWDGRYNDVDAPVEVYAYIIEIKIKDCKNQISKGNVTIIR